MDFSEQLRILQAAQGNPALLALATVDLAHHALPASERSRIKDALLAAAVPHWCDRDFLAALLKTEPVEGERLLGQLRTLTVIEPFPARGENAVNVHETARLALREHLRVSDRSLWQTLSTRARAHVIQTKEPHARIEALYHLFAANQDAAAQECEALDCEIDQSGRPEIRSALSLALCELTAAGWLGGAAEVEALLSPLEVRVDRGEAAKFEADARRLVNLARTASHRSGLGRAHSVLGDVLTPKGQLDEALKAYREFLATFLHLVSHEPSNLGWQRNLAIAHAKVGDIHGAQGRIDDALAAYHETLTIFKRLSSMNPSNAGWQRDLAVAYSRIGDTYHVQGRLNDALPPFDKQLEIFQHLVLVAPSNTGWQRELAVAHSKVGEIYKAQERLGQALASFQQGLTIFQHLAMIDPSNVGWQRGLAVAHSQVGDILQTQGRSGDALKTYVEYLANVQRIALSDPSNAEWQRDLAIAQNKVGQSLRNVKGEEAAQLSFQSAVEIMKRVVAMAPRNVGWERDLDNLKSWLR